MLTARIDIKNAGAEGNDVEFLAVSDKGAQVVAPKWFRDGSGTGHVVTSDAGSLRLRLRCTGDGVLTVSLRGLDVRDDEGKRIPYWIDYTCLEVDGEPVSSEPDSRVVWHDRPYRFKREVRDGEEVSILLAWRPFNDGERLRDRNSELLVKNEELRARNEELQARNEELRARNEELTAIRNSRSFKIGRAITWLPRKVRDLFRR